MSTFLLIPGAGGDAWYWHRLVAELEHRGHRAIAVELPADDASARLSDYVDVAVDAGGTTSDLIVVGQSMGGLSAPLLCERLSVTELILVNAMIPCPGETGADWWSATGHETVDFDPVEHFFHDVPDDIRNVALAGGKAQSDRPFADPWPLDAWPDVPTRVIAARDDRFFPLEFQARVARERLGIEPETLPGGHLVALSRPTELANVLLGGAGP